MKTLLLFISIFFSFNNSYGAVNNLISINSKAQKIKKISPVEKKNLHLAKSHKITKPNIKNKPTILKNNTTKAITKKANKHSPITLTEASLVVDYSTGKILHKNKHQNHFHPASLTKLMTLYLIFEAIQKKQINLTTNIPISSNAAKAPPCKLGLLAGDTIKYHEAIMALIVKSANDVSIAVAEHLGGQSQERFVHKMNLCASKLGMKHTFFTNPSGLHHESQKTTAVDMIKLAIAIKKHFPQHYKLFSRCNFMFRGSLIKGHNEVTAKYLGAEGMKTGYTSKSGYNLITTAKRKGLELVAVVAGAKSSAERNKKMVALLDQHFEQQDFTSKQLAIKHSLPRHHKVKTSEGGDK